MRILNIQITYSLRVGQDWKTATKKLGI